MHRYTQSLPAAHHDSTEHLYGETLVQNLLRAVPGTGGPFDVPAAFKEIRGLVRSQLCLL
jgi:hypothetical protein